MGRCFHTHMCYEKMIILTHQKIFLLKASVHCFGNVSGPFNPAQRLVHQSSFLNHLDSVNGRLLGKCIRQGKTGCRHTKSMSGMRLNGYRIAMTLAFYQAYYRSIAPTPWFIWWVYFLSIISAFIWASASNGLKNAIAKLRELRRRVIQTIHCDENLPKLTHKPVGETCLFSGKWG